MKILITGGAGYIGSATTKALIEKGHSIIIVDNLSKCKKELIHHKAKFYQLDLINKNDLKQIFRENQIDAVIHFASYKAVEESMTNPSKYTHNIIGTVNLLNLMVEFKISKIIFSSSAAVYGIPDKEIVDEKTPTKPINFYGYTKLNCENLIKWYHKTQNIQYISLRYFNVAGDAGLNYIDPNAQNLFPIIMEVINKKRSKLLIFGNTYPTRDNTCIRDYIDINDLVEAHILALTTNYNGTINLGTNKGYTVKEIVNAFTEIIKPFPYEFTQKRKGDPATLIASNTKAKQILNWTSKRDIKDMVESTYKAYQKNNVPPTLAPEVYSLNKRCG